MKKLEIVAICFLVSMTSILMAQKLSTKLDSLSYAAGITMAKEYKQKGLKVINTDMMAKGIKDYFDGSDPSLTINESKSVLDTYFNGIKQEQMMQNKEAGEAFLVENGKKEGITTTASGLQYEVLSSGEGASPALTDQVLAHYHGMLIDGTVFDSSVERGQPITLPVNGVIEGWQEALQMMKVGDKWRLYIPYNLAYGPRGAGGVIKPYSALIFDVELLEIK